MGTGLTIRDFTKVYREARYANQGALRLSEIEHNAYLNRLTLEITHYDADRAFNRKTLPDTTHWGYITTFKGSSVSQNIPIKFVKQRAFELINSGIWQYHQNEESADVITGAIQTFGNLALGELSYVGDGVGIVGILLQAIEGLETITAPAFSWLYEQITGDQSPEDVPTKNYNPYPIASPFPDVFKFKSDIPTSFLFRLESWYLVNPAIYITSNPTDTDDATAGEDEYPEPAQGDGDGDSSEFPPSSPNDPDNDPRDGGQKPVAPLNPQQVYVWQGTLSGILLGSNPAAPKAYDDPISFQAAANQSPFTARGAPNVILFFAGEPWGAGCQVLDRFGQVIFTYAPGVGFRQNAHTVSVNAVV